MKRKFDGAIRCTVIVHNLFIQCTLNEQVPNGKKKFANEPPDYLNRFRGQQKVCDRYCSNILEI
jgi:hypothetical protein